MEKNSFSENECAAIVNKLILTLKEQKTEEKFCQVIQSIKSESKKQIADRIKDTINENIENYVYTDQQKAFEIYMKAFLLEAKYRLRYMKGRKQNEE